MSSINFVIMTGQIGIADTLDKLNHTVDVRSGSVSRFGFRFLTDEAEQREIIARKYTKGAKQQKRKNDLRGNYFYNLQKNGVIMLHDLTNDRIISVTVALLYAFKDFESDEWQRIFH